MEATVTLVFTDIEGSTRAGERPDHALQAATEVQRALARETWSAPLTIKVRAGVHTGLCHTRGGDYFGPTVNRVGSPRRVWMRESPTASSAAAASRSASTTVSASRRREPAAAEPCLVAPGESPERCSRP